MKKTVGAFDNYLNKEMCRAILKFVLLKKIAEGDRYPYSMFRELRRSHIAKFMKRGGGDIKNDVYNVLKSLEKSGYIKSEAKIELRKMKTYFVITPKGKAALYEAKGVFMKFMREVSKTVK